MPKYERSEQRVWTDEDFDVMGWHDAAVHALAFESTTLLLDLDYALGDDFEADSEEQRSKMPSFWMSPSTLVFAAVDDIEGRVGGELAGLFGAPTPPAPMRRRRFLRPAPARPPWTTHSGHLALDWISRSEPDDADSREWILQGHSFRLTFRARGFRMFVRRDPVLVPGVTFLTVEQRGGLSFAER